MMKLMPQVQKVQKAQKAQKVQKVMTPLMRWGLTGLLFITLPGPNVTSANQAASPPGQPAWNQRMKKMVAELDDLLIDLSSTERYNDPKNRKRIEKHAKTLSELAHGMDEKAAAAPDADPSVRIIGALFEREAKHAYQSLKDGHRGYARGVLRSLGGYCVACHTRGTGPEGQVRNPELKSLGALERANFFSSTRQFERALDTYEEILKEKSPVHSMEWEGAARAALAVAIRVKNDENRAMKITDQVLAAQKAPLFLKDEARHWKRSIEAWKKEPVRKTVTEEGLFAEAKRLLSRARDLQRYPADRSADVEYLRAGRVIHELLGKAPDGKHVAEAFYMAGLSYEALNGLGIWDLHDLYYQACIHKSPHTNTAQDCYRQYEASLYAGYSGSGGTHLPGDVQRKLDELRALAMPSGSSRK